MSQGYGWVGGAGLVAGVAIGWGVATATRPVEDPRSSLAPAPDLGRLEQRLDRIEGSLARLAADREVERGSDREEIRASTPSSGDPSDSLATTAARLERVLGSLEDASSALQRAASLDAAPNEEALRALHAASLVDRSSLLGRVETWTFDSARTMLGPPREVRHSEPPQAAYVEWTWDLPEEDVALSLQFRDGICNWAGFRPRPANWTTR